jgi:hypothetical protein
MTVAMRPRAAALLIPVCLALAACGGGKSKTENQDLEERAFAAHSAYLVAEAELLAYRARTSDDTHYARRQLALAKGLEKQCQQAVTEAECPVGQELEEIVDGM